MAPRLRRSRHLPTVFEIRAIALYFLIPSCPSDADISVRASTPTYTVAIRGFQSKERNMRQEDIDRINALYHKSQSVGLTEEEKEEQARLRKEYVAAIRASLRGSLNNISIQEKDGTITDLGKKFGGVKDV